MSLSSSIGLRTSIDNADGSAELSISTTTATTTAKHLVLLPLMIIVLLN